MLLILLYEFGAQVTNLFENFTLKMRFEFFYDQNGLFYDDFILENEVFLLFKANFLEKIIQYNFIKIEFDFNK